jgi:hypothetical protein
MRPLPALVFLAFAGGEAQEPQLLSISATPFAQDKMESKSELLEE